MRMTKATFLTVPLEELVPTLESIPFENNSFRESNRFLQKVPKMAKEPESRFLTNRNRLITTHDSDHESHDLNNLNSPFEGIEFNCLSDLLI